jgi:hypothetical protein
VQTSRLRKLVAPQLQGATPVAASRRQIPKRGPAAAPAEPPQVRVNRTVRARRGWAKFGDCEGQPAGHKENGVVNIAEKARTMPSFPAPLRTPQPPSFPPPPTATAFPFPFPPPTASRNSRGVSTSPRPAGAIEVVRKEGTKVRGRKQSEGTEARQKDRAETVYVCIYI